MCNDDVWMRFMSAVGTKADFKTDRVGISYMLAGDDNTNNADPFDTKPDPGEVWVQEGPHLMIVVPDAKMLEGISDDLNNGGPFVMFKGTRTHTSWFRLLHVRQRSREPVRAAREWKPLNNQMQPTRSARSLKPGAGTQRCGVSWRRGLAGEA